MVSRTIKIHHYPSAQPAAGTSPLLFVHGGYSNARCWEVHFTPFFQRHGRDCYALDLSGHGASSGREQLNTFTLGDYADDLAWAVDQLPRPPVLITHSMGCLVAQRYLERGGARGVAFLAPVPATGTLGTASRLAVSHPDFFSELPRAVAGKATRHTLEVMADVYFSPHLDRAEVPRYLPLLEPESERAVAEMITLPVRFPGRRPKIPALVMGGSDDAVFPPSLLYFTSAAWLARTEIISGAGHMLMLDPQWDDAARRLYAWVSRLG